MLTALMHDETVSPSVRSASARSLLGVALGADEIETQEQLRELERRFNDLQASLFEKAQAHDGRV